MVDPKTKGGVGDEWQNREVTVEAVRAHWKRGGSVGVQLGEASNWLCAGDADDEYAIITAPAFLPETLRQAKGDEISHYFFYSDGLGYRQFNDLNGDRLIDLKASANGAGHLVVVEPSRHPDKGPYGFVGGFNPAAISHVSADELGRRVRLWASSALIAKHLPKTREEGEGGRHDLSKAIAGFGLRNGWTEEEATKVLVEAWKARRAPQEAIRSVERNVADTAEKLQRNEPATGGRTLEELIPGLASRIAKFMGWERPDVSGLPKIKVNNRHLRDVTADALDALVKANEPPEVFVRSGALVRVCEDENGNPYIQTMDDAQLRGQLARTADFVKFDANGRETKVSPPEVVVKDLAALSGWPLPPLETVVESPILRADGTIFDTPGYDPETRLYYKPVPGFDPPKIPDDPTDADIEEAISLVDEAVGEFPFEDKSSAANTLAALLTPLVRHALGGPVPMALLDKPQAGTGGSLLAEVIATIATGRDAEMLGATTNDEEWRKQITAKLAGGASFVILDNVDGALYAPSLARAITARTWTDRLLGRSETITVSQRATWIANGNNIILRGDLPRRCYWIRLDAKHSKPWQREGFKHPDLLDWVRKNRGRLVGALLTLARAWFAAGNPKAEDVPRLGSFEGWAETVGGMVAFSGISGFLGNLDALYEKADEETQEWEAFLHVWEEEFDHEPVTVAEISMKIAAGEDGALSKALPADLAEALGKSTGSFKRKLGKALSKRAGMRFGEEGLRIVKDGTVDRAIRWKLEKGSLENEFRSFLSFYNPTRGKNEHGRHNDTGTKKEKYPGGPEKNSANSETHPQSGGHEQSPPDAKCIHEVLGGCYLCRKNRQSPFYEADSDKYCEHGASVGHCVLCEESLGGERDEGEGGIEWLS